MFVDSMRVWLVFLRKHRFRCNTGRKFLSITRFLSSLSSFLYGIVRSVSRCYPIWTEKYCFYGLLMLAVDRKFTVVFRDETRCNFMLSFAFDRLVTQFVELYKRWKPMKYCLQSLAVDCWLLPEWWLTMTYYLRRTSHYALSRSRFAPGSSLKRSEKCKKTNTSNEYRNKYKVHNATHNSLRHFGQFVWP